MYFGSSFGKKLYLKKPKIKYRYISDHSIPGKIAERYVNKVPEVSSLIIYIIGEHVLSENQEGNFKIGKSTSDTFDNRIKSLQTGNPNDLKVYLVVTVSNPKMESICHKELSKRGTGIKKRKGEWFYGSLFDIRSILFRAIEMYDIRRELL